MDLTGGFSKPAPPLVRATSLLPKIRRRIHAPILSRPATARRRTQVSAEALNIATSRYSTGETLRTIASDMGLSRQRLASLLKEAGVSLRRASPSEDCVSQMIRLYASGESLQRVGSRLGFSPGTVRNRLEQRGIRLRDTHGRQR